MKRKIKSLNMLALFLLGACATQPYDYTAFRQSKPRSILVLPPLNASSEVMASYGYLSTVTYPLAEKGFYVFPVTVIDQMLKENGLPTPGEMHQASPKKLREIINPDAILYINLERYGTKFHVIDSNSTVTASAKLVDAKTGKVIWNGKASANHSANAGNQGGFLEHLITAAVAQAVNTSADVSRDVSRHTNAALFLNRNKGLLKGPYHEKYNEDYKSGVQ